MKEKVLNVKQGDIHYWVNSFVSGRTTLVFLPGLTADHRLFERQIEYFAPSFNVLVWDAPGHYMSRPFELSFSLMNKATWLHEILLTEGVDKRWTKEENLPLTWIPSAGHNSNTDQPDIVNGAIRKFLTQAGLA